MEIVKFFYGEAVMTGFSFGCRARILNDNPTLVELDLLTHRSSVFLVSSILNHQ